MSQENKVKHRWNLVYNRRRRVNINLDDNMYNRLFVTDLYETEIPELKMYRHVFESSLIPGVKFDIFCYIPSSGPCHVILSKTPSDTLINATITINCTNSPQSVRKTVDCWTDSCILILKFDRGIRQFLNNVEPILRFQCVITWHTPQKPESPVLRYNPCDRLKNFLTVPDLSDMTIVIDEKEIPVHKIILATYSPVFLAMFKADMTETVDKRIVITDIEVDIIKKVIEFMYTGILESTLDFNDLLSVLEVADKYEIIILKELCEGKLTKGITVDNVFKILERASLYGVPQLIETLISFMVEKKSEIVSLDDFTDLYRRKPELLFEFVIRSSAVK